MLRSLKELGGQQREQRINNAIGNLMEAKR